MSEPAGEARKQEAENLTCTSITSQYMDLSTPLKLKPYALVGAPVTECCGEPIVTLRQCQGVNCGCEITITQTVCVKVPITYGTEVDASETVTICKKHPGCNNCGCR